MKVASLLSVYLCSVEACDSDHDLVRRIDHDLEHFLAHPHLKRYGNHPSMGRMGVAVREQQDDGNEDQWYDDDERLRSREGR